MEDNQNNGTQQPTQNVVENNAGGQAVDYSKIDSIVNSRNAKTEQSILKEYFGKQGLSEDEMKSAIDTYKQSKQAKVEEKNNQFTNTLNENSILKEQVKQYQINESARDVASDLGVETKTIPYLLKMADLSKAFNEKGEIDNEAVKTALNKVLEDIPALKSVNNENKGFVPKAGAENNQNSNVTDEVLKNIFGG